MWKWEPVFTHIDLARAVEESKNAELTLPARNAITGPTLNTVLDYISECERHETLSVDIEVYGYTATGTGEIACVGIGFRNDEALCIPITRSGGIPYWNVHDESVVWRALATLLQNPEIKKVGQNLAFEWIYFWLHHVYPANMYIDTMLLHHTLYPDFGGTENVWGQRHTSDAPGHSLAFINSQYTRTPYYKDDGRRWTPGMGDHAFWRYNCMDVMVTLECALALKKEAEDENLWDFYIEYQQRPFIHSTRMEWFGVGIDTDKRALASRELLGDITRLQDKIDQRLGYALNVNSPKQMNELLYKKMGLKVKMKRGTRRPTADKETLRNFAEQTQDEVLLWVQELRQARDLKGDIVDQPLGQTGRMHTHYKQGGTDSNRWSSTKSILGTGTNLQNVPRKGIARHLFVPS
jgi:DNA polymerase-1